MLVKWNERRRVLSRVRAPEAVLSTAVIAEIDVRSLTRLRRVRDDIAFSVVKKSLGPRSIRHIAFPTPVEHNQLIFRPIPGNHPAV